MTFDPFRDSHHQATPSSLKKGGFLAWDETAADNLFTDPSPSHEDLPRRSQLLLGLLVLTLSVFAVRLVYVQVVRADYYLAVAEDNRLRSIAEPAPRGLIQDRYGKILATNRPGYQLVAVRTAIPANQDVDILTNLSILLGLPQNELLTQLNKAPVKSSEPVVLARGLTSEQNVLMQTRQSEFPGFAIETVPTRQYTDPLAFSHAIGYVGPITESELEARAGQKYLSRDLIGKSGIESEYEEYIRGVAGSRQYEVDSRGRVQSQYGINPSQIGNTAELTIDSELQTELYQAFTKNDKNIKGAAIALNPKTGEVLAILSLPGFDSNLFSAGISSKDYQALLNDKNLPLFNRAIAGQYPPGSTIKMLGVVAGLEEEVITPETVIVDNGVLIIPNQFDPNISYRFRGWDLKGLGPVDARLAIAVSSDIYFYTIAGGHPSSPNITPLGATRLAQYYRDFGLGQLTGIDLQGEKAGVVSDPQSKKTRFPNDAVLSKWYQGDTYHISIGQGDTLSTPLQVAQWTALIANGGLVYRPHLLKDILKPGGTTVIKDMKPEVLLQPKINPENWLVAQEGMRLNVTSSRGSGRSLQSLSVKAAGKTGTSQFDGSDPLKTHAWYTAYAPYEDPQIVITVLVEAGGEGHAVAVPVVRQTLDWWTKHRYGKTEQELR